MGNIRGVFRVTPPIFGGLFRPAFFSEIPDLIFELPLYKKKSDLLYLSLAVHEHSRLACKNDGRPFYVLDYNNSRKSADKFPFYCLSFLKNMP